MVTTKRAPTVKKGVKKLKLKKETLKDLDVKGKGKDVKGEGVPRIWGQPTGLCLGTAQC